MTIVTIGRDKDNNIVVSDNYVGRHHLQLIQDDRGNYLVSDLNSTNGTYVNGKKITGQVHLNPDDIIRIGNTTLPWKSYFAFKNNTSTSPIESKPQKQKKPEKEKKPINWRNILSIVTAIISLLLMILMAIRYLI
jgi:pSer/pThr/pTyr-binding forkhead associated (FHA) protein